MHKVFHRRNHGFVHHLQARWNDARGNHPGDGLAGFAHVVKAGHDAARQLRLRHQFDEHFKRHRQHAFAAHHHAHQIVAGCIQRLSAQSQRFALHR